jgi:tellurite resistance protein TerC
MNVPGWLWVVTVAGLVAVIVLDLIIVDRRPHSFGPREATRWVLFYIALACAFAVFIYLSFGTEPAAQFVAGYLTEYALSVDNLFVFLVIMSSFAVPAAYQHRVLLIGIVIALVLRAILIVLGAELLSRFTWAFFGFGALLLFTAWKLWFGQDSEPDPQGNALIRFMSRRVPTVPTYHGTKLSVRVGGRRALTPMAMVMLAIGTTDLLFALDSIPAVLGITQEAYLVFSANAFALMGLRQLYFLLSGLIQRLRYLSRGLAIILAFIGVKMVLEALHSTWDLPVPTIPIWLSLLVIVTVLAGAALASLWQGEGPDSAGD